VTMALEFDHRSERRGPSMRPASRARTRIALVVVALAVGVLVGMQIAERDDHTTRLAAESPQDLTRILADLNAEADALGRQVTELRLRLVRYRDAAAREDLVLQDARKTLEDLQVLAGATEVRGPGVVLAIQDPRSRVTWDSFLDLVQELRDGGAEAVAVIALRIVASTWFGPDDAGVVVDGEVVASPYRIEAIGTPGDLREALGIPGGPLSLIEAQPDVAVQVQESERLQLPPLQRETTFRYARPAG
jgi:uncharacterized protein YlxW (UPF0749 family)